MTDEQLSRAASLLPSGLTADSASGWTSFDRQGGYPNTWNSPEYIGKNRNFLTKFLRGKGSMAQKISTALESPGRGTIGGFVYRTTPEGIEISDGYEFAADPKLIRLSDVQSDAYNEMRMRQNLEHRAKNRKSQKYFIPWDVYSKLKGAGTA